MARSDSKISVELFATCPQSKDISSDSYARSVADVARWSEQCGCKGILVYTDNSIVDPWLVSQIIIENTKNLCPLVAIQPVYMHPYSVAKMVASFGFLYRRRIYLNLVAGGFKNDLAALNDTTAHDKRYARIIEYTSIIKQLLAGREAVTVEGEFYKVDKLRMTPPLAPELFPGIFISRFSELAEESKNGRSPYWLRPFETYKTFCPYLVGSYEAVAEELSRYISAGYSTFILDIPPTKEELHHTQIAFETAAQTSSVAVKSDAVWRPVQAVARPSGIT